MSVLANARYERFARIVADGKLTPTAAYRETLGADARDPDVNSLPLDEEAADCRTNRGVEGYGSIEECFQSPVEGAIYAETVDKLRG